MKRLSFNKNYNLKPDKGKVLVLSALPGRNMVEGVEDSFTCIIHPIYAMILSHFDNREYNVCINDAAESLDVPKDMIKNFVNKLIDNPQRVYIKNQAGISSFPPYVIVSDCKDAPNKRYNAEVFSFDEADLRMTRHMTPSSLTLMVNNICRTDCVYCYQDKSRKINCGIPLYRIIEIIREARQLNVNSIDVIGGEFFLYPYWKEVLGELKLQGYSPYISTKIPLSKEDVEYLSEIGVHDIQISLDSLIEEHLLSSLRVKAGYLAEMLASMRALDSKGISMMVHSVLTKHNAYVEDMSSLYSALLTFHNIKNWHIVKGDPSLYERIPYKDIEIEPNDLNLIVDYLKDIKKEERIKINHPGKIYPEQQDIDKNPPTEDLPRFKERVTNFFNRTFCSGLFSSLYILPDGKVTMCEQLYWNPDFIVGDLMSQSLEQVWNSKKATRLFDIKREDIPNDSKCHSCSNFTACRSLKQVCYREIIRKHGKDRWYYPDVNCPFIKS